MQHVKQLTNDEQVLKPRQIASNQANHDYIKFTTKDVKI